MIYEVDLYKDMNNSLGLSLMGDSGAGIFIKSAQLTDMNAGRASKIQTGDRLLSVNDRSIEGMVVQQVADLVSLASNPCRLRLSRQGMAAGNRRDSPARPVSVDADSLFQQHTSQRPSKNFLVVC